MGLQGLPRRRLYHEITRAASACAGPSAVAPIEILCYENEKEARLQGINIQTTQENRFVLFVRDQDGTNPHRRRSWYLAANGYAMENRRYPESLVKLGGNKEICVLALSGCASANPMEVSLEILELMG